MEDDIISDLKILSDQKLRSLVWDWYGFGENVGSELYR